MRVFIVHAHPEVKSFNGALTRNAIECLDGAGHEVIVSDLYRMGFNPVSGRANFRTVHDPEYFRQQAEEAHAAANDGFTSEIQVEQDKLFWCDLLVFQFPLWWFGLPAILKGWVDRVFAAGGRTYGGGKWYDRGVFAGRRAMCSVTIGGPKPIYSQHGLNGPIEQILFPINHGMFYFTGFAVLEPFLVHAPMRMSDTQRFDVIASYRQRLLGAWSEPAIEYPKLADHDDERVLIRSAGVDGARRRN